MRIARHLTAISRNDFSSPIKIALKDQIINVSRSFFDYGCGKGTDVEFLKEIGVSASGWDPAHGTENIPVAGADIVNIGYVINVIENPSERIEVLQNAYALAEKILIVSVLLDVESNRATRAVPHNDGILTSRGTFQKFYTQSELKQFIKETLNVEPVSAGLGIVYVFKDEVERQLFLATRVRRYRYEAYKNTLSLERKYDDAKAVLEKFVQKIEYLGRIPFECEFEESELLKRKLGSFKRAYKIIKHIFPNNAIELRKQQRVNDLLVYLALSRFQSRPPMMQLPETLQNDMKAFFGSYSKACQQADELLFLAGKSEVIDKACGDSGIGKILPSDLYIHKEYLEHLSPVLRIYVGCAQALVGEVDHANIVKIHRHSGKVSYLIYEDFDKVAHPPLKEVIIVLLRTLEIRSRNYRESENPPILHRKDTFILPDYPGYAKFKKLTLAEEAAGLLTDTASIGFKNQWEARLSERGYRIRGHQLLTIKTKSLEETLN